MNPISKRCRRRCVRLGGALLGNEYHEITWFAYTSCDEEHPVEEIDWDNHMIYVNTPDDLFTTYTKTRRTYELIRDKVDFDWVVRTNTSVFINVKNLLKRLDEIYGDKKIYSIYSECPYNGDSFLLVHGFFYMRHRNVI